MDGKVLGIPLVLILLVLFIAALVDVPMLLINMTTQTQLVNIQADVRNNHAKLLRLMETPAVTPSVTPTPTVTQKSSVRTSLPATTSGQVR